MKFKVLILFSAALLAACNPYKDNFVRMNASKYVEVNIPQTREEIKLYAAEDMAVAESALLEDGYIPLGSSRFNSSRVSASNAIDAAKDIGASVVVVKSRYSGTLSEAVPFTVWRPDQRMRVYEREYDTAGLVTTREQIITVEGEYETRYIEQSREYYDYEAVFWARMKNPKIGLFVADLTDDERRTLQTNRGVSVQVVVKNTPAFYADILKGDILLELNGERINERRHFFRLVSQNSGKEVKLSGLREGSPLSVTVFLNK